MIVDNTNNAMVRWIRGSSHGYPEVYLYDINGKHFTDMAHRIVAATYFGDISGKIVHHRDEDKENPAVSNLIVADSQNEHVRLFHSMRGESNPTALLTNDEIHLVCKLLENRVKYRDIIDAVKNENLTEDIISKIAIGKNWADISSQYNIPRVTREIMNEFSDMADYIGELMCVNGMTRIEVADLLGIKHPSKRYDRFAKCAKRYAEKYKNNHGV